MSISNPLNKIKEKKIPISKLGVASRTYLHWKSEGLLFKDFVITDKRQKVFLNLYEATWVSIIKEFRMYNFDLSTIKQIKDKLFTNITPDMIAKNPDILAEILERMGTDVDATTLEMLKQINVFDIFDNYLDDYDKFNIFSSLGAAIGRVLLGSHEGFLINIDDDQTVLVKAYSKSEYYNSTQQNQFNEELNGFLSKKSCYVISITAIVESLLENDKLEKYNHEFGLYTKEELNILEAIKQDNWKKITVVKHRSGDLTITNEIEVEKRGNQAKELKKILGLKQYEQVEVIYRNDQHLLVKNTKKEIIKKS